MLTYASELYDPRSPRTLSVWCQCRASCLLECRGLICKAYCMRTIARMPTLMHYTRRRQRRREAWDFLVGSHARIGARSKIRLLAPDALRHILEFLLTAENWERYICTLDAHIETVFEPTSDYYTKTVLRVHGYHPDRNAWETLSTAQPAIGVLSPRNTPVRVSNLIGISEYLCCVAWCCDAHRCPIVYTYHPGELQWRSREMPSRRILNPINSTLVGANECLYILGGTHQDRPPWANPSTYVDEYNVETDRAQGLCSMPSSTFIQHHAFNEGVLYAFGALAACQCPWAGTFDRQRNTWERIPNPPAWTLQFAVACRRGVYVAGNEGLYRYSAGDKTWSHVRRCFFSRPIAHAMSTTTQIFIFYTGVAAIDDETEDTANPLVRTFKIPEGDTFGNRYHVADNQVYAFNRHKRVMQVYDNDSTGNTYWCDLTALQTTSRSSLVNRLTHLFEDRDSLGNRI